jgi:hypothetical protein
MAPECRPAGRLSIYLSIYLSVHIGSYRPPTDLVSMQQPEQVDILFRIYVD